VSQTAEQGQASTLALTALLHLLPGQGVYASGIQQQLAFTTERSLEIRNATGQTVLVLPPATAYEQANPRQAVSAHYRLAPQADGQWQVGIETPWSWWADPARTYPIVLDPWMQVLQPADWANIVNGSTNVTGCAGDFGAAYPGYGYVVLAASTPVPPIVA